jgi:hypothetical protein
MEKMKKEGETEKTDNVGGIGRVISKMAGGEERPHQCCFRRSEKRDRGFKKRRQ